MSSAGRAGRGGSRPLFAVWGISLALVIAVFSYSAGAAMEGEAGADSSQYLKLGVIALVVFLSVANLFTHKNGLSALLFVTRSMAIPWMLVLIGVATLPFSYYPDISVNKLTTTIIGMVALNIVLSQYAPQKSRFGRELLHRHLLYIFALFIAVGVASTAVGGGGGEGLRWMPTLGLIHPNIMASAVGLGCIHALLYRDIMPGIRLTRCEVLARAFVFVFGLPIFLLLYSRGALLALVLAGGIMVAKWSRKSSVWFMLSLALTAALVIALLFLPTDAILSVVARDSDEKLTEMTGRNLVWEGVFEGMDLSHLLTGYGYAIAFPSLRFFLGGGYIYGTHNAYLQALTSGGIFGMLLFVYYALSSIVRPLLAMMKERGYGNLYALCCSVFFFSHCFSESLFGTNLTAPFVFFICCQLYRRVPLYAPREGRFGVDVPSSRRQLAPKRRWGGEAVPYR